MDGKIVKIDNTLPLSPKPVIKVNDWTFPMGAMPGSWAQAAMSCDY